MMTYSNVHISHFSIEVVSTGFYANGRQQCHVRVKIMKQGQNTSGMFVRIPLTAQERNSVSAALLSSSLDYDRLPMPAGWRVTQQRNQFQMELVNTSAVQNQTEWSCHPAVQNDGEFKNEPCLLVSEGQEVQPEIADIPAEIEPKQQNEVPEIINLYVSASATGTQTLMAKARLQVSDGNQLRLMTFTTNMRYGNNTYNSRINLNPIQPFVIHPDRLSKSQQTIQNREENVTKWDVHHQQIILFRWSLPFNIRIHQYSTGNQTHWFYALGNTHESNRFLTRGCFHASGRNRVDARDNMNGGCVWGHSYEVNVRDREMAVSLVHVRGCSWTSDLRTGTHTVSFIDSFGNQQGFTFSPRDTGRDISVNRHS